MRNNISARGLSANDFNAKLRVWRRRVSALLGPLARRATNCSTILSTGRRSLNTIKLRKLHKYLALFCAFRRRRHRQSGRSPRHYSPQQVESTARDRAVDPGHVPEQTGGLIGIWRLPISRTSRRPATSSQGRLTYLSMSLMARSRD
jgi:hypothetical protein